MVAYVDCEVWRQALRAVRPKVRFPIADYKGETKPAIFFFKKMAKKADFRHIGFISHFYKFFKK